MGQQHGSGIYRDRVVFHGSSSMDWDVPYNNGDITREERGYTIGEFPSVLEPGASITEAFVVYCKEGDTYAITVASLDGDSASFDFRSAPGG